MKYRVQLKDWMLFGPQMVADGVSLIEIENIEPSQNISTGRWTFSPIGNGEDHRWAWLGLSNTGLFSLKTCFLPVAIMNIIREQNAHGYRTKQEALESVNCAAIEWAKREAQQY